MKKLYLCTSNSLCELALMIILQSANCQNNGYFTM
uniref:Uncharacterized protein n=1 Tax=Arundo donax TaxID=35708 RepID=A0A0A8Z3C7_ARUDO